MANQPATVANQSARNRSAARARRQRACRRSTPKGRETQAIGTQSEQHTREEGNLSPAVEGNGARYKLQVGTGKLN